MARKVKGSANRAKARAKVARAHRKVRASRADFLHRASARLVRDHDVIVIEDLAVKNTIRTRPLAKAISDCGWGPPGTTGTSTPRRTFWRQVLPLLPAELMSDIPGPPGCGRAVKQEPRPVTAGSPVHQGGE